MSVDTDRSPVARAGLSSATRRRLDAPALQVRAARATVSVLPWGGDPDGTIAARVQWGLTPDALATVALSPAVVAGLMASFPVRSCRVVDTPAWTDV
jgi:hypothetical protein